MSYLSKNSKNWAPGTPLSRLCIGLLITLVAFTIRKILHPFVEPHVPLQLAVVGAIVTEFFVGCIPAFISLALGLLMAFYFFIPPDGFSGPFTTSDLIIVANNVIVASTAIILLEYLQRANYSTRLAAQVTHTQRRSLMEVYNQVLFHQRKSQAFVKDITSTFASIGQVLLLIPAGQPPFPMPALHRLIGGDHHADEHSPWHTLIHPEDVELLQRELHAIEHAPASASKALRFRLLAEDGSEHWVDGILKSIQYRHQWRLGALIAKEGDGAHRRAGD